MYYYQVNEISKDLMAGSLAPLVLLILKKGESYGYEIIHQLRQSTNNKLDVAEGTLYPVLKKMEAKKWVKATWKQAETGRQRRYYTITAKGKEQVDIQYTQWNFINDLMQKLWHPQISRFTTLSKNM